MMRFWITWIKLRERVRNEGAEEKDNNFFKNWLDMKKFLKISFKREIEKKNEEIRKGKEKKKEGKY